MTCVTVTPLTPIEDSVVCNASSLSGLHITTSLVIFALAPFAGFMMSSDSGMVTPVAAASAASEAMETVDGIKSAYAEGRLCSVASRPRTSSSAETRRPIVFLMMKNVSAMVTEVHARMQITPRACVPSTVKPPP